MLHATHVQKVGWLAGGSCKCKQPPELSTRCLPHSIPPQMLKVHGENNAEVKVGPGCRLQPRALSATQGCISAAGALAAPANSRAPNMVLRLVLALWCCSCGEAATPWPQVLFSMLSNVRYCSACCAVG